MEIKEFLKSHPFINAYSVEKALGIPVGTIRVNSERPIPEKYRAMIIESLNNYVPIREHVVVPVEKMPPMPVVEAKGRRLVVKRVTKVGIGEHAYIFGKMENGIFKRDNDIQDGASVVL
jgi:hypothetical protein